MEFWNINIIALIKLLLIIWSLHMHDSLKISLKKNEIKYY